jgi:hypothetical protein
MRLAGKEMELIFFAKKKDFNGEEESTTPRCCVQCPCGAYHFEYSKFTDEPGASGSHL